MKGVIYLMNKLQQKIIQVNSTLVTGQHPQKQTYHCKDCGKNNIPRREIPTLILLLCIFIAVGIGFLFKDVIIGILVFIVTLVILVVKAKPKCRICRSYNVEPYYDDEFESNSEQIKTSENEISEDGKSEDSNHDLTVEDNIENSEE